VVGRSGCETLRTSDGQENVLILSEATRQAAGQGDLDTGTKKRALLVHGHLDTYPERDSYKKKFGNSWPASHRPEPSFRIRAWTAAAFAAELRKWLEKQNLSVWQDLVALEGGRDWWSQIEDALKSKALQHFILIITPAALDSPFVRSEIRLARQQGKTVCPVKGPGLGGLASLPRWVGQIYDLDLVEHRTTLTRVLQDQSRQKRVPMMAPEPPPDFVQRSAEFNALKTRPLDAKGDPVAAITTALRGAGGYGKTTLAKALAHDPDVQDAYFDGILWSELGKAPQLVSILNDLIFLLTGDAPKKTEPALMTAIGEALGDRRILLIIDDAQREHDLRYLRGGSNTVRLVTTRIDSVLPDNAVRQRVDAMQASEALELLANGLPLDEVSRRPKLAGACHAPRRVASTVKNRQRFPARTGCQDYAVGGGSDRGRQQAARRQGPRCLRCA
jgi:hypothetical protein